MTRKVSTTNLPTSNGASNPAQIVTVTRTHSSARRAMNDNISPWQVTPIVDNIPPQPQKRVTLTTEL